MSVCCIWRHSSEAALSSNLIWGHLQISLCKAKVTTCAFFFFLLNSAPAQHDIMSSPFTHGNKWCRKMPHVSQYFSPCAGCIGSMLHSQESSICHMYVLLPREKEVQQESVRLQSKQILCQCEHGGDGCICRLSWREYFLCSWPCRGEVLYHLFTLWGVLCCWEVRQSSFLSPSVWIWCFISFPEVFLFAGKNSSSYK